MLRFDKCLLSLNSPCLYRFFKMALNHFLLFLPASNDIKIFALTYFIFVSKTPDWTSKQCWTEIISMILISSKSQHCIFIGTSGPMIVKTQKRSLY